MTWMHRRLLLALALSLLLHIVPFAAGLLAPAPPPRPQPPLEAELRQPPPPAQPPLMLPEPPQPVPKKPPVQPPRPEKPAAARPAAAKPLPARTEWTAEVRKQLKEMDRRGKFYPEEAIAQGLEGEAVVLLVLDEAGNPAAARIETSSGHRILDDAALRAVRSLRSLPAGAPRETLLPVRFRLR